MKLLPLLLGMAAAAALSGCSKPIPECDSTEVRAGVAKVLSQAIIKKQLEVDIPEANIEFSLFRPGIENENLRSCSAEINISLPQPLKNALDTLESDKLFWSYWSTGQSATDQSWTLRALMVERNNAEPKLHREELTAALKKVRTEKGLTIEVPYKISRAKTGTGELQDVYEVELPNEGMVAVVGLAKAAAHLPNYLKSVELEKAGNAIDAEQGEFETALLEGIGAAVSKAKAEGRAVNADDLAVLKNPPESVDLKWVEGSDSVVPFTYRKRHGFDKAARWKIWCSDMGRCERSESRN